MSTSYPSGPEIIGHYFDGKTAISHDVFGLQVVGLNLVIHCLDGGKAEWALAEIDRKDDGSSLELMRFGIKSSPDERLILLKAGVAALGQLAPNLTSKKQINARHRRTLLYVMGGTAALMAFIFVGIPMASYPLAHMTPLEAEEALGESAKFQVQTMMARCENEPGQEALQRLVAPLIAQLETPRTITVELMEADFPNAMALPGGTIYVTDDMVAMMETPEQLAGVIGHEIGHVERRDSVAGLIRQLGFAWLLDAIVGGSGIVQGAVSAAGGLASLHYSRAAETGSDKHGVALMRKAGLNPSAMADFFDILERMEQEKLAKDDDAAAPKPEAKDAKADELSRTKKPFDLFRTHPNSGARADAIRAGLTANEKANSGFKSAATDTDWLLIRTACSGEQVMEFPDLPPLPFPPKPTDEPEASPPTTEGSQGERQRQGGMPSPY